MERLIVLFVRKTMMASAIERLRQLLSYDTKDLLWLGYVVGIAPWMHRVAAPLHELRRRPWNN